VSAQARLPEVRLQVGGPGGSRIGRDGRLYAVRKDEQFVKADNKLRGDGVTSLPFVGTAIAL
jgi:hypothetical protein